MASEPPERFKQVAGEKESVYSPFLLPTDVRLTCIARCSVY